MAKPTKQEVDMVHELLDKYGVARRLPCDDSPLILYERVWALSERLRKLTAKPEDYPAVQKQVIEVVRLRRLIRDGHDDEGNLCTAMAPQVLADEERKLGRIVADVMS